MKKSESTGGFGINEESEENLLCIPFSEEQLEEIKKYAAMNGMEVEEFIINICLTHCLQQMEHFQGQKPEGPEAAGRAQRSDNGSKAEQIENMQKAHLKKIEMKSKTTSKDLLDGPLVLDQQCIMDLFAIKRQFCNTSNNEIIMVALKMGLNQLSVSLDMLKHKLKE